MKIEYVFITTMIIWYTEFKEIRTARSHKFNNDYIIFFTTNYYIFEYNEKVKVITYWITIELYECTITSSIPTLLVLRDLLKHYKDDGPRRLSVVCGVAKMYITQE